MIIHGSIQPDELRYNIKLRDRLRKRFFKSKSNTDRNSFKRQRNKVNNMIKYMQKKVSLIELTILYVQYSQRDVYIPHAYERGISHVT